MNRDHAVTESVMCIWKWTRLRCLLFYVHFDENDARNTKSGHSITHLQERSHTDHFLDGWLL